MPFSTDQQRRPSPHPDAQARQASSTCAFRILFARDPGNTERVSEQEMYPSAGELGNTAPASSATLWHRVAPGSAAASATRRAATPRPGGARVGSGSSGAQLRAAAP